MTGVAPSTLRDAGLRPVTAEMRGLNDKFWSRATLNRGSRCKARGVGEWGMHPVRTQHLLSCQTVSKRGAGLNDETVTRSSCHQTLTTWSSSFAAVLNSLSTDSKCRYDRLLSMQCTATVPRIPVPGSAAHPRRPERAYSAILSSSRWRAAAIVPLNSSLRTSIVWRRHGQVRAKAPQTVLF